MTLQTLRTFNRLQLRHPQHEEQGQEEKNCNQLQEKRLRKQLCTVILLFVAQAFSLVLLLAQERHVRINP